MVIVVPWEKNSMPARSTPRAAKLPMPRSTPSAGFFGVRRNLLDRERAVGDVEQHQIGMGAADIDAQSIFPCRHRLDAFPSTCPGNTPRHANAVGPWLALRGFSIVAGAICANA